MPHSLCRTSTASDIALQDFSAELSGLRFAELHRHLEGSIRVEWLPLAAREARIELPSQDPARLRQLYSCPERARDLMEIWEVFTRIGELFSSRDAVKWITFHVAQDAVKEQISYLEMRLSPLYMAEAHKLSCQDVMEGVIEGLLMAREQTPSLEVNLILIIERQREIKKFGWPLLKLASRYMGRRDISVTGLDLANDEANHPPGKFAEIFKEAAGLGLHITVHAGEGAGPDNVKKAVSELGAERIGHGFSSYLDDDVMELLRRNHIPLEVCPTSNFKARVVDQMELHPLPFFVQQGLPVTLSTDDPGVFDCDLPGEYRLLVEPFGLNRAQVLEIARNSYKYAFFANSEQRERVSLGARAVLPA